MAKSDLLRVDDVRAAYRLIGDCRDLGSDPALWFPHMLEGLSQLLGARTATGGEGWWIRSKPSVEAISGFQSGLKGRDLELYVAHIRRGGPNVDPVFKVMRHVPDRHVTRTRRQAVLDSDWYRSELYIENFRPTGIDHRLVSFNQVSDAGAFNAINLDRAAGDRDFSPREQRLLHFFHDELGRLVGGALVSATEPDPEQLSPRLRQTLACLLQGDSEKQVAARLGLAPATAHQYVTALYRRFGVRSRAQLLVHAMRRAGRGQWSRLPR
jgi:DNA-binding CsgD family transcriptional regulator